jgi:GT2 family glycosyltransferase
LQCRFIYNKENLGFSTGHNLAYHEVKTPYFLLQNVDMYLSPDVLEKLVNFMEVHSDTVSVTPRLMRWDCEKTMAVKQTGVELNEAARMGFTTQIDAIGIRLFRNRRAVEWLTRQEWSAESDNKDVKEIYPKQVQEVFGVSGAFPMYRKSITDKVLLPENNLFDPTYHSYKEDLDLAYRLRNAGYVSYVLLDAVAYHDRLAAGPKTMSDTAAMKNKTKQSYYIRFHSYKNHLRTLYKNEYWQNFLIDFPYIFWYEFKKFIYLLIFNPAVIFNGWKEMLTNVRYTISARRAILSSRKMYWKGIRRWM